MSMMHGAAVAGPSGVRDDVERAAAGLSGPAEQSVTKMWIVPGGAHDDVDRARRGSR